MSHRIHHVEFVFDPQFYHNVYPDLAKMSIEELEDHWFNFGIKENRCPSWAELCRVLPRKFNVDLYAYLNQDLKFYDDLEYYVHYYQHGRFEDRPYRKKDLHRRIKPSWAETHLCGKEVTMGELDQSLPVDWTARGYFRCNPDLKKYGVVTEYFLKKHWWRFGRFEHRPYRRRHMKHGHGHGHGCGCGCGDGHHNHGGHHHGGHNHGGHNHSRRHSASESEDNAACETRRSSIVADPDIEYI